MKKKTDTNKNYTVNDSQKKEHKFIEWNKWINNG